MTRRDFLGTTTVVAIQPQRRSGLGLSPDCFVIARPPRTAIEYLEKAHSAGAAGVQSTLASQDPAYLKKVRSFLEERGMYLEIATRLPGEDTSEFEAVVRSAKEAGAECLRSVCLTGRRYETFNTLDEWNAFAADAKLRLARAVKIVEKHRFPLGLENHKDWTADELESLMKQYGGDYLGVCLDTGNNIALLDDPMEVIERLAPYAFSTHIKDMAVDTYADGFLLSEVPVGEGILDMKRIVASVQRARPKTRLTLEMITRNPLPVPCLTDRYWATFPGSRRPYLGRTMRMVKERRSGLPRLDGLDDEAQHKLEDSNVVRCLRYFGNG